MIVMVGPLDYSSLLNQALDIEHDVTGDCKILGPLAEEWGVDYERDRSPETP